jgi:anti-sigma B factor antagonist
MAFSIRSRDVGGAVVLEIIGRISLGEGSSSLRDCIRDLLAHQKTRIVLDLSQVSSVDSSGLGELVNAFTTTTNQGGKITLSHPRLGSMDLMAITKLKSVFEITSSVEDAISGIKSDRVMFLCCIIGCETWSPFEIPDRGYQVCTRCDSRSKLVATGAEQNTSSVRVDHVRLPTYGEEVVVLLPGRPCRVEVCGRLDLFAFNSARKAALTLHAAVVDLTSATEITQKASSALVDLLAACDSTVFLPKGRSLPIVAAGYEHLVFDDLQKAEQAHFEALERRSASPVYERGLHTYLLRSS